MNLGIVAVRYARALLKASLEAKEEDAVYKSMQTLSDSFIALPELNHALKNPTLSNNAKTEIIQSACGNEVSALTQRFILLVIKENREDIFQLIAQSYLSLYRKQKNIITGKLTTAVQVSEEVKQKMQDLIARRTDSIVEFKSKVDPDIIGGFILEYDTYCIDASIKTKLHSIEKQLKK